MSKGTAFRYNVAQQRGSTYTSAVDYVITQNNILKDGYGHYTQTGTGKTFTLPAASLALKGVSIYVTAVTYTCKVFVSGGFGGGGTNFDVASLAVYETSEFWCNGSYWYALNDNVSSS